MKGSRAARGDGKLGCIIWLAIAGLIGYCLYQIVPVKVSTSQFEDFMKEEASFGSIKAVPQLQKEILEKAKELDLPVGRDNLSITRTSTYITVEAHYEVTLEFFGGAYRYVWKFDPVVKRPLFNV
jgi:hypothetical protein